LIRYSEYNDDYSENEYHSRSALLTCPSLKQRNTYDSWSRDVSSTLALLQSYKRADFYGLSADQPYVSRNAYGCYILEDRLNQAGTLSFKVLIAYAAEDMEVAYKPVTNTT
jgi:hypothetical protein